MKLIFSDLDSTLLDHHTYSFAAAAEALDAVRRAEVPLILCSSKTKGEMRAWQARLGIEAPFIAENGGGICLPPGGPHLVGEGGAPEEGWQVVETSIGRAALVEVLTEVKAQTGIAVRGFSEMTVEEVMALTGLAQGDAALAMARAFTEPFILPEGGEGFTRLVVEALEARGLRVVKGGRFYHLMGRTDKGEAARRVRLLYEKGGARVLSIGLGDSENDLPLLFAVDRPVIVRRWDGRWLEAPGTEGFDRTEGIGPAGWNEAVLAFLAAAD